MAISKIPMQGFSQQGINFRNIIINGDMSIAQRGTSTSSVTTTDGYYACDRWYTQTDIGTWTISQSTDVPTGQGFSNSLKLDCTTAGSSNADEVGIRHKIEGQNLQHLKYGTSSAESLTVSFWIKTNKTGTYSLAMVNSNSTQERIASFNYTVSSADTWEKKTITFPGDTARAFDNTTGEELTLYWWFSAASGFTSGGVQNTWTNYSASYFADSGLAGLGGSTSDEVYITGVQAEVGSSASDFEFLPFDINLSRCNRYYTTSQAVSKFGGFSTGDENGIFFGRIGNYSNQPVNHRFPVRMRSEPTVTVYSLNGTSGHVSDTGTSAGNHNSDDGVNVARISQSGIGYITGASGDSGDGYAFQYEADAEM